MCMAACLGMSKKKQLTCRRHCRFSPFCKFNVFTRCYICVACKIIFPHKLYAFRSFISWWIKSHTSNFSFSPLNRVDVCRVRFFYSKLICKGKQSIFTIITSCKSSIINAWLDFLLHQTGTYSTLAYNKSLMYMSSYMQSVTQSSTVYLLWIIYRWSTDDSQ